MNESPEAKEVEETEEVTKRFRFSYKGLYIHKLVEDNPRRPVADGHKAWECIEEGMLYEDYVEAGGASKHLRYDWERGRIELRNNEGKSVECPFLVEEEAA
jgi:hypothetical protein